MKFIIPSIAAAMLAACAVGAKADTALSQLPANDDVSVPVAAQSADMQSTQASAAVTSDDQVAVLQQVQADLSQIEQRLSDPSQQRPGADEAKQITDSLAQMSLELSNAVTDNNKQVRSSTKALKIRIDAAVTTLAAVDQVTKGPGGPHGNPGGGGHSNPVGPAPYHPQPTPHPQPQPVHPQPQPIHPQPEPIHPHPGPIEPFHPYPGLRCVEQDGVLDYDNCGEATPWHCYAQFPDGNMAYGYCAANETQCYSYGPYAVTCNY
jgi:hypothetical protein